MDIDNRNFIDVMKELSSNAGVELPKDNTDNKKLSYTRQVTKPPVPAKTVVEPSTQAPIDDQYNTLEPVYFDDPLPSSNSHLILRNLYKKVIYTTF